MEEEKEYYQEIDSELIDTDFDHIDPYGEIMEDDGNGEHHFDNLIL